MLKPNWSYLSVQVLQFGSHKATATANLYIEYGNQEEKCTVVYNKKRKSEHQRKFQKTEKMILKVGSTQCNRTL
jgi:hypothetical protein